MFKIPNRHRRVSKAAKEWSEDEASVELLQELEARATPPDDNKSSGLRSRRRTASAHASRSDSDDSQDEDGQPLSGLRSGKRRAPSANAGSEAEKKRSRRSSRRLSTARAHEAAVESDSEAEEVQGKAAPAKRQRLRKRSQTAAVQNTESPERSPAGRSSARIRAASHNSKALPAEQKHYPEQQPKSRGTRAATRARAAALQHDSSPVDLSEEEQPWPRSHGTRATTRARAARLQHDSTPQEFSEEEQPQPRKNGPRAANRAKAVHLQRDSTPQDSSGQGSEPEALHLRHATGSRPKRKASKLVQGGGGISDDDDSASDMDNFIASSEDDPEEVSSQAAANADDSDAQTDALDPAAILKGRQTAQGKPGSASLRRIRKAPSGAEGPATADGLADALADSERESQPQNAAEHGQQSDAGYQRYTPEQKGKQKLVEMLEDTGPSGLHEALTPAQAAKQQSAASFTPALRSSGLPPSKRRRLQKANGQTVKEEEDPGAATGVRRSSRVRMERPEFKFLWQKKAAKARTAQADLSDELADSEDDGGFSNHADEAGPLIIDDDEDDGGSGASDAQDGASEGADAQGEEANDSDEDIDDFIDEPDDGMQIRSPLQLAGLFENRPDVDNCFNFYLDYLLECIADPDFPEVIRGDPRARKHYDYAIQKIEIDELARWRETYTKSDAWKRAIPGFITALERLPGCSVQPREAGLRTRNRRYSNDLADEDLEGTVRECAACMRKHTRAVLQLVLKGKLGDPGYIRGAKRLRDMAIRDDDEGQNESDRESILGAEDGESKERVYDVGSHCASRVHLYHSLWHYKRRLRCQLKKELKAARLFLEGCGLPHTKADCVKHVKDKEGLYDRLRSNFKQLDGMAKEYATMQASGGFRHASGTLDRVTKKVSQLMYRLNDDSDADSGSKLQSDTDGEAEVVSDEEEAGPSGLLREAPEEAAALPRRSSEDVRRRLVLGNDDSEAGGTENSAQPSCPAAVILKSDSERSAPQARTEAPLDSKSEVSALQARAGASARHRAGQVIESSSEEEMQGTGDRSRQSKAARQPQRQYRKPDGQPRYVQPAKRQSGRRAEDALKMAAASFQASPSRSGPPAAVREKLSAPGTPEHSGSPSRRPQPYFMASPQRRPEGTSQQQAHHANGEPEPGLPEPRGQRADAPGIGTDLGALLRQAQGSDAVQRLASLVLPERQDDSYSEPGVEGASAIGNSEAQPGVSHEDVFQQMALEAAAASREALAAALSYPDDSPCSPEAGSAKQQHFQQGADAIEPDSDTQDGKRQADGDMDGPEIHAEHSATHVASTDHELALALDKSEKQAASTQKSLKSQSVLKPQRSVSKQSGGGSRSSRGRGDATKGSIKVQKDADSLAKQKSILKYFSPRS